MQEDYLRARKIGMRQYNRAVATGRYPYLTALDDIVEKINLLQEYPVGIQEIPLSMVVGTKTKGRQQAFSCDFMPILELNTEFGMKWYKLYDSAMQEGVRESIKVYEYMHRFYVQEGNKRVSVSKFLDSYAIAGDVTRILPEKSDDEETLVYYEFVDFFDSAPIYEIEFTQRGSYERLAAILGQELGKPWPIELVDKLRGGYQTFEKIYTQKTGGKSKVSPSDAFLSYVIVYGLDDLSGIANNTLSARIGKMWNEILIRSESDNIALVKSPEELGEEHVATNFVQNLLGRGYSKSHPLKVAFCYERPAETSSWLYGHELGRNYVEEHFDGVVETIVYDHCSSDEALATVIDDAVLTEKCEVIFTISPKQMEETMRCALHYPKVKFLNCSINLSHANVRTYYSRMFEAKAILGALAASLNPGHKLGYVADYPIYGSVAEINAFATGAAMVDPETKVYLTWTSVKDADPKKYLTENDVRIVSGHDFIKPDAPSREYGLFRVLEDGTSVENIATPVWNWGRFYELILQSILDGRWEDAPDDQAINYWWGMSAGVVDIILSNHLSYYSHKLMAHLKNAVESGSIKLFEGEIHSQEGVVHRPEDEHHFHSDEIIQMDWLNDNVIGSIPTFEELTDAGKDVVRVSGIVKPAEK